MVVENHRKELSLSSDLKQVESLTGLIETRLREFYQTLPRPDPRRSLFGIGGSVLKSLFGVVKESDIRSLHETLDDVRS
jgi:hypothetical protein